MKENIDYIFIPKVLINDPLNAATTIKGPAILTKRYFFVFPVKVEDMGGTVGRNLFDKDKFADITAKMKDMEPGEFEINMIEMLPAEYVMPWANFERFTVDVGFFIFGGLRFKKKGGKAQSATAGNAAMRKAIQAFVSDIKIG